LVSHKKPITNVLFCPKRPLLASTSFEEGIVKVWNTQTGEIVHELEYGSICFSPSGEHIVVGRSNVITEYNVESGKSLIELEVETEGIPDVVYSPNGNFLIHTSKGEYLIVWDIYKRQVITTIGKPGDGIINPIFGPDEGLLTTSSVYESSIKFWDVLTGELLHTIYDRFDEINSLSFNAHGTMLAVGIGGRFGHSIDLWRITKDK
jgi:WD40 repeat protein